MNSVKVLSGELIAARIRGARPQRIAVAYLGLDWHEFVPDASALEVVVLAPILGTNPRAVESLVRAMSGYGQDGWERVLFLDELHAKLYLGASSAVWGSANLSQRGLSGKVLVELAACTDDETHLVELRHFMDQVVAQARDRYPTVAARKKKLSDLYAETRRNPRLAVALQGDRSPHLSEFELLSPDQFYVSWYMPNAEPVALPATEGVDAAAMYSDWTNVLPNEVESGRWLLLWPASVNTVRPLAGRAWKPRWMFIDEVLDDAADPELHGAYTTMILERSEAYGGARPKATPPFDLEAPEVRAALRQALMEPEFSKDLIQSGHKPDGSDEYSILQAGRSLPRLIARMKAIIAR